MNNKIIAVDIGNSFTKIGLINNHTLSCSKTATLANHQRDNKYAESVSAVTSDMAPNTPLPCVICSVVPEVTEKTILAVKPYTKSINLLKYSKQLPVTFSYENPETLGADRIANSLYAFFSYKKKDVVVIDAGTTITIDYISKTGCFKGGVIIPGLKMQYNSLSKNTSQLPDLEHIEDNMVFPGKSTESCINLGVVDGTAGAVSCILNRYTDRFHISPEVITCGGSWNAIKTRINFTHQYIPECTLLGTAIYNEYIDN